MEHMRQEGLIEFMGLFAEGGQASIANWVMHDAFEIACFPREGSEELTRMALSRRVGVLRRDVISAAPGEAVLVPVRVPGDVKLALGTRLGGVV